MESTDSSTKDGWPKADTLQLIKLVADFKRTNNNEKVNNNELYMHVANKLFEYGYSRTYVQCKNRWKELLEMYTEYKKSTNGDPPPFYTEIDNILADVIDENDYVMNNTSRLGPPWTQYETSFLIKVMKVGKFVNKLKTDDPLSVYNQIAQYMQKVGPVSRTKEDIQQRWRNLKRSYIKYIKGDLLHFKYFETMDDLLDWEPNSIAFEEDQFKDGHEYGDENYQNPDDYETKNAPSVKRALNWTHKEIELLLDVVQKYNMKQMKREDVSTIFDEASIQLRLQGFKRSSEQCRIKFKHLKVKYFGALRRVVGGEDNPERYFYLFERMRDIMQNASSDNFPDIDNDNSDFAHDEQYEVEYLEETEDVEPESFAQVFLKEHNINNSNNSKYISSIAKHKKGRPIWSQIETQYLLNLLKKRNVKRYCRRPMFEEIALEMCKAGFKRSAQMCMIKWKNLRNSLYSCIRNMVDGKEEFCPFYEEICEIVQKNGNVDVSLIAEQDTVEYDESENEDSTDTKYPIDSLTIETIIPEKLTEDKKRPKPSSTIDLHKNSEISIKRLKTIETNTDISTTDDTSKETNTNMYTCNYKMDDTEHYCMSLATTFKRLSKRKQAKLKIEIQKLLFSAEFDDNF